MTLKHLLFSFDGRISRKKYWIFMFIPFGFIFIGLFIGGFLAAQSMIEVSKYQKFCRDQSAIGKMNSDCTEISTATIKYKTAAETGISAIDFCKQEQAAGSFTSSCADFVYFNENYPQHTGETTAVVTSTGEVTATKVATSGAALAVIIGLGLLMAVVWWASLAITTKRLHDANITGWVQIIGIIIPLAWFVIFIICAFIKGTEGDNKYGSDPLAK